MAGVTAVMISSHVRASERRETLASLATAGISPLVIESTGVPSATEQRAVSTRALLATPAGHHVLFCEDDIRVTGDLRAFLAPAVRLGEIVVFCNIVPATHEAQARAAREDGRLPASLTNTRVTGWVGTQCVLIPPKKVEVLLWYAGENGVGRTVTSPFDLHLQSVALALGWEVFTAFPNPVQHVAGESVRRDKPRVTAVSVTAGVPATGDPSKPIIERRQYGGA